MVEVNVTRSEGGRSRLLLTSNVNTSSFQTCHRMPSNDSIPLLFAAPSFRFASEFRSHHRINSVLATEMRGATSLWFELIPSRSSDLTSFSLLSLLCTSLDFKILLDCLTGVGIAVNRGPRASANSSEFPKKSIYSFSLSLIVDSISLPPSFLARSRSPELGSITEPTKIEMFSHVRGSFILLHFDRLLSKRGEL